MPVLPTRRRNLLAEDAKELTPHHSFASGRSVESDGTNNSLASAAQQPPRSLTARGLLVTVVLALMSYAAGSSRSCTSASSQGTSTVSPTSIFPGNQKISTGGDGDQHVGLGLTGLPPADARHRPYYDLVVAVFVASTESHDEISRVRKVYARYGSEVVPAGNGGTSTPPLTFKVVFVVGRAGVELPEDVQLPDTGLLMGDFYHVEVREGYKHLSDKTKAMTGLANHLRFRFLAKTDSDTFPCLSRTTQQLVGLPKEQQQRVYAGLLNKCGTVFPAGHKLHDPEFKAATGGTIDCHPMYHQGAFYILGEDIVNHLNRSRDMLSVMSVEDAMMGLWLLGVNKVLLDIGGSFYCKCFTHPVPKQKLSFYHFCKTDEKMDACLRDFGAC